MKLSLFTLFIIVYYLIYFAFIRYEFNLRYFYFSVSPILVLLASLIYMPKERYRALPHYVIALCVPVWGPLFVVIGVLLTTVVSVIYKAKNSNVYNDNKDLQNFSEDMFDVKTQIEKEFYQKPIEVIIHENIDLEPFIDILNSGTTKEKLRIINQLGKTPTQLSIKLLKRCLKDSQYEVRYFSNNTLEKLENTELEKIEMIENRLALTPNDFNLYNQRSQYFLNLVYLDLCDQTTKYFYLEKALYDSLMSLQINENQSKIYLSVPRIYITLKDYENAKLICLQALKLEIADEEKSKILFFLAECFYHQKDFLNLKSTIKELDQYNIKEDKINNVLNHWRGSYAHT